MPQDPPRSLPESGPDSPPGDLFDLGLDPPPGAAPRSWQPPAVEQLQAELPAYEVKELVARGGMGAVYKGVQKSLDRFVAIKILPPDIDDGDLQFAARFKHEAEAMARLSHPNIVAVYDAGETAGGMLYFVMEFVKGTDVAQLIAGRGRLDPAQASEIAAAVCDALAFAHEEGIIHRDIKPSNVMIDGRGRIKVADFGLAKSLVRDGTLLTRSDLAMGSPDYIAPEAQQPGALLDGRADLYGVGVMLYQMLTGRIPRGRFEPPSALVPQLAPGFDAIVDRALQTDREKRYATAAAMKADIERAARLPTPRSGRTKARLLAVWLGAAALGFGAVFWATRGSSDVSGGPAAVVAARDGGEPGSAPATRPFGEDQGPGKTTARAPRWQRSDFAAIDASMLGAGKTHSGREGDALRLRYDEMWVAPGAMLRDMAVRATLNWSASVRGPRVLTRMVPGQQYFARLSGQSVDLGFFDGKDRVLKRFALPASLREGEEVAIMLASTGERHFVWVNGNFLGGIRNVAFGGAGRPALQAGDARFKSFEWISLEGLTAAEAMRAMGLESEAPLRASAVPTEADVAPGDFVNSLGMRFVPVPITGGAMDRQRLLFSVWETRVEDYRTFVGETGREWPPAGFEQGPSHPAVGVSWDDAQAFCVWLTGRERGSGHLGRTMRYRLPTDHEWSCAAGIGDREDAAKLPAEKSQKVPGVFPWGSVWPPPPGTGNFAGEEFQPALDSGNYPYITGFLAGYRDGYVETAPVGSFPANSLGLHDLGGNVWEFCEDWFDASKSRRVARGASWLDRDRFAMMSSHRYHLDPGAHVHNFGFRCVIADETGGAP